MTTNPSPTAPHNAEQGHTSAEQGHTSAGGSPEMTGAHVTLAPGVAQEKQFAHVKNMFDKDRATKLLGVTITHLSEGRCQGNFRVREDMCNGHGTTHGGIVYAFADAVFAGACNSYGEIAVAAYNSIHYLAPTSTGDLIEATAVVQQRWGRNGLIDVNLTCDGKPIAEFRGTFRIVPRNHGKK